MPQLFFQLDTSNYHNFSKEYQDYVRDVSFLVPRLCVNPANRLSAAEASEHAFVRAGFGMGAWLVTQGQW
jgi:hypothetical protein